MSGPLVVLDGVVVRAGPATILERASLRLEPGEVVGVSGPNGVGKTTLLRVVATLLRPTAGGGSVLGARLATPEVFSVRSRIGLAGHHPALAPDLTLTENLGLVARLAGASEPAVAQVLEMVGLAAAGARRAGRCSHGMQRRVDLARLLLTAPELLLLDEAQAGLDAAATPIIDELLARVRARRGGAVLVSHDGERLARHADRVVAMDVGRLEA